MLTPKELTAMRERTMPGPCEFKATGKFLVEFKEEARSASERDKIVYLVMDNEQLRELPSEVERLQKIEAAAKAVRQEYFDVMSFIPLVKMPELDGRQWCELPEVK